VIFRSDEACETFAPRANQARKNAPPTPTNRPRCIATRESQSRPATAASPPEPRSGADVPCPTENVTAPPTGWPSAEMTR
jgi:hypothetical protein